MILSKSVLCGCAALLLASSTAPHAEAGTIVVSKTTNLLHSQTESAFFTASSNGSASPDPADGWAPIAPTQAGAVGAISTTPKKSFSFIGNSTSSGNWVDGNGIPAGITLTFDAQLTLTALPSGSYLTNPGAAAGPFGQGIGITQTVGGIDDIDVPDGLGVSAVTVSNVSVAGTLTEPGYVFAFGGVNDFGTILFRSNNFVEGSAGMLLTQGGTTIGFGTASGNAGSGLLMENNFGAPAAVPSSTFARQSGPYTLVATQGTAVIKGMTLGYDIAYDVVPVPEPNTLLLVAIGALAMSRVASCR